MGGALVRGWVRSGADLDITVTAKTNKTLEVLSADCPSVKVMQDNAEAARGADVVVVAVKPWLVDNVIEGMGGALDGCKVISVAANARNPRDRKSVV